MSVTGLPRLLSECWVPMPDHRGEVVRLDAEALTEAAIPTLMEVFGCDHATAWNALYPPNGALGPVLARLAPVPSERER